MKINFKHLVLSASAMLLVTGCTWKGSAGVSQVEISSTDMNNVENMKRGEACHSRILIFPIGFDATAKEAAKNGGISKIKYQEWEVSTWLLGSSSCLIVYGQ